MTEVANTISNDVGKSRHPRRSMTPQTKEKKYQPYQLNKQTSKEGLKKIGTQISFTSAIESLAILSPPPKPNVSDPFAALDKPSQCKYNGKETEKTLEKDESADDAAATMIDYLADLLPSPVEQTPVDECILLPVVIDLEESSVDPVAKCNVSHTNHASVSWNSSPVSVVELKEIEDLSFWRLRQDLTTAYIFADESQDRYVVNQGDGKSLRFVSKTSLGKIPHPISVDINDCAKDPRVFFFEASTQDTGSGFLIPSTNKGSSVKYDTSSGKVILTTHDAGSADAWEIKVI